MKNKKHMKTKQHATKKTSGSMMKSKKKSENTSRQIAMNTEPYKIYGMQQKHF